MMTAYVIQVSCVYKQVYRTLGALCVKCRYTIHVKVFRVQIISAKVYNCLTFVFMTIHYKIHYPIECLNEKQELLYLQRISLIFH